MNQKLKDIIQLICVSLMAIGIIIGFAQASLWINQIWSYPFFAGLSILTVLGAFEIIERSQDGK